MTPPKPVLWTFSAAETLRGNTAASLLFNRDRYCPPGKPIKSSLTLRQALANARAIVVTLAGAKAVNAFDHSDAAKSATQARAAAVDMFTDRKPVPTLLALLRFHQLQPNDPSILGSISALLNILGYPKESLAVAKAADAMSTSPGQTMGISGQAILLNNEGHAMLGLRRWSDAERVLRTAVSLSPELSEAKVNLAVALLCQHEDDDAVRFFRLGQYRRPYHMVTVSDFPTPPDTAPATSEAFDLSHGVRGELPNIRIPAKWSDLSDPVAREQLAALDQEWTQRNMALGALERQLNQQTNHLPAWAVSRYGDVMVAAYSSNHQPRIRPLHDAWTAADDAFDPFIFDYSHTENGLPAGKVADLQKARYTWPECNADPPTPAACDARWQRECADLNATEHAIWLPLMHAYDRAIRTYYRADYRYMTALVANLADPLLHRLAMVEVKLDAWNGYHFLISTLSRWSDYLRFSNCNSTPPTDDLKVDNGVQKDSAACPVALKGVKFAVKFGDFVKLSMNCEQFGIEVASKSDILWVGFFGEGSFNFVKGTGTVFAGVKAGGKIPETGISVSAKEGMYLTVGSTGIDDVGMRVSTSGSFGLAGGPTVDMKGPSYQISWASQTITFH